MSSLDIIYIPILLGVVLIPTLIGYTILDEFQKAGTDSTIDDNYYELGKDALMVFDAMIIFILVSVGLGALILAASVRTHPAFSVVSILMLTIFIAISAWFANAYWEISNASQLAVAANEMDNFARVINNLPLITAVLGVAVIIATYAKPWERVVSQEF